MHGWRSSPTRSFKTSPPMLPCVITNEEHCRIGSAERGLCYLQRTKERRQGTVEHYETEHCKGSKRNRTWQPLTGLPPTTRHWEAERSSSETCCHCLLKVMAKKLMAGLIPRPSLRRLRYYYPPIIFDHYHFNRATASMVTSVPIEIPKSIATRRRNQVG